LFPRKPTTATARSPAQWTSERIQADNQAPANRSPYKQSVYRSLIAGGDKQLDLQDSNDDADQTNSRGLDSGEPYSISHFTVFPSPETTFAITVNVCENGLT